MPRRFNSIALVIGSCLLFFFVSAAGMGGFTDLSRVYLLMKRGQETKGWITAKEPNNHRALRYRYMVGTTTHEGTETLSDIKAGDRFEHIRIGDEVKVVFVPDQPDISCACNPTVIFRSDILFIAAVVLLGPLAILVLAQSRRITSFQIRAQKPRSQRN